jgi:hypothetical protein
MINIREKFLQLTKNRTPKGLEDNVIKLIPEFDFVKDEFSNYYYIIKKSDGTFSDTMFTSHLDTIDRGPTTSLENKRWNNDTRTWDIIDPEKETSDVGLPIKHVFDGDFVKSDGRTNLGADDKAGVTIMLNLMSENVPGLYYFFMGEESGCVGSSSLSRVFETKVTDGKLPKINRCISFDRKGYDSVITKQMGTTCCSDEFAKELASKINEYGFWYKPDDGGVYTDSAEFIDIVPECSNISVGYFSEHTTSEKQDLEFLELLAVVLTKIDWDSLKVVRDVTNVTYKGKKSSYGRYSSWGWDDYDGEYYGGHYRNGYPATVNTTTTTYTKPTTSYMDEGKGKVSKITKAVEINDEEFDKWYLEQKNKGWTVENTSDHEPLPEGMRT